MVRRYMNQLALTIVLSLPIHSAIAFKVDPGVRPGTNFKSKYSHILSHFIKPVHEQLSVLAYVCATQVSEDEKCPGWEGRNAPDDEITSGLLHGSRWNDDPNNSFIKNNGLTWVFWMLDAERTSNNGGVKRINPLQYRSHYGDLQFLHAMSSGKDRSKATQLKVINWTHFAYDVAIGEIAPDTKLASLVDRYPFVKGLTRSNAKINWTVAALFMNALDFKGRGEMIKDANIDQVPIVALGALLHTLQDSYSMSHTQRENPATNEAAQSGKVKAFLDYSLQRSRCHAPFDMNSDWLEKGSAQLDNPVDQGAWIVRKVFSKAKWSEVEARIISIYEPIDPKAPGSSGGLDHCN